MELNSFQKDIIRKIANAEVYDLLSFFSTFFKDSEYKHNYEDIKRRKKKDYDDNKNNIEEYLKKIKKTKFHMTTMMGHENYSTEEINNFRNRLANYEVNVYDFYYSIEIGNKKFGINALEEGVYISDDKYLRLLDFLSIWQLLQSEKLILTIPCDIDNKIIKLFFKKKDNKENNNIKYIERIIKEQHENNSKSKNEMFDSNISKRISNLFPPSFNEKYFYKKDEKEYSDTSLIIDNEIIMVSQNYIDKKILVLPDLLKFVQNDFISSDEIKYRIEHRLTVLAVVTSIFFSIVSLVFSLYLAFDDNKFWSENERVKNKHYIEMNRSLLEIENRLKETSEILLDRNGDNIEGKLIMNEIKEDINKILELIEKRQDNQR